MSMSSGTMTLRPSAAPEGDRHTKCPMVMPTARVVLRFSVAQEGDRHTPVGVCVDGCL
ncbi:hypothetical protein ACPCK9_28545 [Streptomyces koyangensis]|uniref:hypothetical protein n=1 Tax=Streptomyces TaxID=1883 RepID=UPI00397F64B3